MQQYSGSVQRCARRAIFLWLLLVVFIVPLTLFGVSFRRKAPVLLLPAIVVGVFLGPRSMNVIGVLRSLAHHPRCPFLALAFVDGCLCGLVVGDRVVKIVNSDDLPFGVNSEFSTSTQ